MDRYSNKAYEQRMNQSREGGNRLNANNFNQSGTRKLYRYSRNLDDDSNHCIFPSVPEEDKRRRGILIKYDDDRHNVDFGRAPQYQAGSDPWDKSPVNVAQVEKPVKPAPAKQSDWKEERKMRVENAMKRVEQSYVGELRYGNEESTYTRPDCTDPQETKKPAALVPLAFATVPGTDASANSEFQDDRKVARIDRSLLIPSSNSRGGQRTAEEEYELDMKRQSLLEMKIREANEFHRKQKLNAFKPCKEAGEKSSGSTYTSQTPAPGLQPKYPTTTSQPQIHPNMQASPFQPKRPAPPIQPRMPAPPMQPKMPVPPTQPKMPVPPIRSNGVYNPMPPSVQKEDDGFSKRRRKLIPYPSIREGANVNVERPTTNSGTSDAQTSYQAFAPSPPTGLSQAKPDTTRIGRHGVTFDVNTKGFERAPQRGEAAKSSVAQPTTPASAYSPKAPLIPRQAAYNTWNGDTAKRGLGFKSKLRKEMEEASLRAVEPESDVTKKPHSPHVSAEVAAKWKRKIFYDL